MARLASIALVAGMIGHVAGQSASVTQVFFPVGADAQPLDASIIAQDGDVKTIVMECTPGTPSDECGFPEPITLTAGPSTFRHNPTGVWEMLGMMDCSITASTKADCTFVTGLYSDSGEGTGTESVEYGITTATASTTYSTTLAGTDMNWLDVTITAGAVNGASVAAAATSSSSTTASSAGGSSSASSSAIGTSSTNDNAAAGSLRVAYTGLAAALVAGSMMML